MVNIVTSLELYKTIYHLEGKIPFKNLMTYEVHDRISASGLPTMPKTSFILESPIMMCDVNVLTTLTFWLVTFFRDGRVLACINDNIMNHGLRLGRCSVLHIRQNTVYGVHLICGENNEN